MSSVELFLQGEGIPEIAVIEVDGGSRVRDLIEHARTLGGPFTNDEEVVVIVEGAEESVKLDLTLDQAGIRQHHRLHAHRCRRATVEVTFNGQVRARDFSTATTIESVRNWAVKEFGIPEPDGAEMNLLYGNPPQEAKIDQHLGVFVHFPDCLVRFLLAPPPRFQG